MDGAKATVVAAPVEDALIQGENRPGTPLVVQRLIAKDGFGPTSGDRNRHSQLIESELVGTLQFDRVVDPTLHATLWMHDPERGVDGLGRGSIEVHPDCRLANVLGVQASRGSNEIQGAIEAFGIRESDDTGDR